MKRSTAPKCLHHRFIVMLLFVLFFSNVALTAQTITTPTTAETSIQSASQVNTVNCDMVQCVRKSFKTLKAVVWDDNVSSTWTSYLFVEFDGTPVSITTIASDAFFPDVVIGDDLNNPAAVYIITVIYSSLGSIYIQTYSINVSGVAPYTVSAIGTPTLISNGTDPAEMCHIDLFSDMNNTFGPPSNRLPALHKYVATWNYNYFSGGGSGMEVYGAVGDISTVTPSSTFSVCTTGRAPDVAACTDAGGTDYACFVYGNGTPEVKEFDVTTTPTPVGTPLSFYLGTAIDYGYRIEAMNQYDGSSAKWTAVASDGSNVYVMNDLQTTPFDCSSGIIAALPPHTNTGPYDFPVVAAGVGGATTATNIGNYQYTMGWYDDAVIDIYSQDIQKSTGLQANAADYYQVNTNTLTAGSMGRHSAIAMSNSSNSGYGVLTAFFDGSDVVYKLTSTTGYDFKPTDVADAGLAQFNIYPNPAKDRLSISNAARADYSISDVTGKTLITGKVNSAGNIGLEALSAGLYLLELNIAGQKQVQRFVKE